MHMNLDPFLVDKIVGEVKSQGVFDQFRKDSMADVDTKPAYQNLRQRVETTVTKFLSDQIWTPDLNKNQLREKLRKHITEAGFLDTGVERIVDQVVNPKISTVFQPKIEDIAYKFLGIEKPQIEIEEKSLGFTNGDLALKTELLPTDLEAVSPDSDKITDDKSESKEDLLNDSDDKNEEFESPPFEPLEGLGRPPSPQKKEESNHSQLSGISGLTSQDSVEDTKENINIARQVDITQESELSEVSSNSRLSIVTNGGEDSKPEIKEETDVGISEEAQMPKFNDSTSSNLESGEHLHFDIKKEEIKFEGTDWKSEKRDYFSCISENLPMGSSEIKTAFEDNDPEKDHTNKTDDASASSNLTCSTDTQISATSKLVDFEKFEKEIKSRSDAYNQENYQYQSKMHHTVQEKHPSTPPSKSHSRSHKKSHKKSSDRDKYNSSENGSRPSEHRHGSYSPRTHSSSKKHKSSSHDYRSKSRSHKSKHSRERDRKSRDKSRSKKHKTDKDNHGKSDDYCSDRKKKYRRKSTDSNDDADGSKDASKNTSTSSLDRIDGVKESNSSNSSNYSANTSGSVEGKQGHIFEVIDENSELCGNYAKPIILDDLLGSDPKSNIELIIGAKILVNGNNKRELGQLNNKKEREQFSGDEADLEYFDNNPVENENCHKHIEKLTAAISDRELKSTVYILNCEKDFESIFKKLGKKVIGVEAENTATTPLNGTQNKNTNSQKVIKNNGSLTENKKNGHKNFDSLSSIIKPYGKRKNNFDDYYQPAYCVFSDEKLRNNAHSLIIDCFEYESDENINKKLKTSSFPTESFAKVSPTPSELSIGSKENEFAGKNSLEKCNDKLENSIPVKRRISLKASQRYSSEDLYKPRPVLSQRSRRRAMETEVA